MTTLFTHLRALGACRDACAWASQFTGPTAAAECWTRCERPDWLLWWAGRTDANTKADIVRVAIAIAEDVLHLCSVAARPKAEAAIQAAKDWVAEPTKENQQKARTAAAAAYAAAAADAAAAAAAAAADAAAAAAYAAAAADAAAAAAYAAAYAAAAAAAAADAAAAAAYAYAADAADAADARAAKRLEYCVLIRTILKQPWKEEETS